MWTIQIQSTNKRDHSPKVYRNTHTHTSDAHAHSKKKNDFILITCIYFLLKSY